MSESLGQKALKGTIWASIDRFSTIGIQFVVNLVLARLLMPADFGAIGMLTIFISVSQTIIDGGFVSALIQKKEPTQTDFSTIFFWNISVAIFLYIILCVSAPIIAQFYHMEILCDILRILGITIIIFSINAVQTARLKKTLQFKSIAIANLSAIIISGIVGITMAKLKFGIWSLVAQQLTFGSITTLLYYILTRWLPKCTFSLSALKNLFDFGGFLFIATIFQEVCRNFQGIIIGRKFSAIQMGYYTQAARLDQVTSNAFPQVISQVMFPVYSSVQDDKNRLIDILANNIRIISFCIFPLMGFLILSAKPIITTLYGDNWLPCAGYFQILCVGGMFTCLQNVNFFAVAAVGKSRDLFLWSIYKWGFLLAAMFVGLNYGMDGLIWSIATSNLNIYLVNAYLASRHIGFSLYRQLRLLFPIFASTAISVAVSAILHNMLYPHPIIVGIISLVIFLCINIGFNTSAYISVKTIIKQLIKQTQ